jgi:hypothetical protein
VSRWPVGEPSGCTLTSSEQSCNLKMQGRFPQDSITSLFLLYWCQKYNIFIVTIYIYIVDHSSLFQMEYIFRHHESNVVNKSSREHTSVPCACSTCPSQWPHGLRHELSLLAGILGSLFRIPPKAWVFVSIYSVFV